VAACVRQQHTGSELEAAARFSNAWPNERFDAPDGLSGLGDFGGDFAGGDFGGGDFGGDFGGGDF
jgi:hypothetical protein